MLTKPTARELRILRNLIASNAIWEVVDHNYFTQFNESTGREVRIPLTELHGMETRGWIRLVRPPKATQKLDRYEITVDGVSVDGIGPRKSPERESEWTERTRSRRGA